MTIDSYRWLFRTAKHLQYTDEIPEIHEIHEIP